jgi:hypothetical protein
MRSIAELGLSVCRRQAAYTERGLVQDVLLPYAHKLLVFRWKLQEFQISQGPHQTSTLNSALGHEQLALSSPLAARALCAVERTLPHYCCAPPML